MINNQLLRYILLIPCVSFSSIVNANLTPEQLKDIDAANAMFIKEQEDNRDWYRQLEKNAQELGYKNAFNRTMDEFSRKIRQKSAQYDKALSFDNVSSLVQTGVAAGMYLVGGIVDEVDASTTTVNELTIKQHDKGIEIVRYPYLAQSRPNWRDYLIYQDDQRYDTSKLPQNLLPRNEKEKAIWDDNIDIGTQRGIDAAYKEILARWNLLFADLRGMTRYWTAVEANQIAPVDLNITRAAYQYLKHQDTEEIQLNPTIIKIAKQSTFNTDLSDWHLVATEPSSDARESLRDAVINGHIDINEVSDSQVIIETREFSEQRKQIPNNHTYIE